MPLKLQKAARLAALTAAFLTARDYGPAVGRPMPGFELHDQDGQARTLKGLLGPKGALILFYRSADW